MFPQMPIAEVDHTARSKIPKGDEDFMQRYVGSQRLVVVFLESIFCSICHKFTALAEIIIIVVNNDI